MHIRSVTAAASTLTAASLLLLGAAAPAQALSCAPGLVPAVVDGVETCAATGDPAPYNPGESSYDPATGNYSEAVPAPPGFELQPSSPAPDPVPTPADSSAATTAPATAPAGGGAVPAPVRAPAPTTAPPTSRTPVPSPSATPVSGSERSSAVLPAAAAVVILGGLAGALLLRHRNRSARGRNEG
ncbi:hypothetical protein LJ754_13165 [Arthrobacter sp. zg-Y40]|uniref:hypothetical protein n=1 Tax=Arthrobacter sp. zg-Y40 TaxID=2886939 RepID=UPI001D132F04|nr:hypothetical protein [Arthrobacter sp. zg-Y40]MCC3280100.1 hypothetical protein [Arthrobacter sp. zg-Y40]